ncbi:MAG: nucleotide exchange factor GrpE [Patescibacteria group bacterium]|jgi:molecular chaperone GrpE
MKDDMKKDTDKKDSALQKQLDEMENNWKRALADYKNLQKRVEEEKAEIVSFSNMILLARLLPVLDNLELLEKHSKDEGMRMITKEFRDVLKDAGVEEIEAEGKEFDPMTMEAVDMEGDLADNKAVVTSVVRRGFKMKDRLIRPARVVVSKK